MAARSAEASRMTCKFCNKREAKYSCPKCNSPYCSLPCYQSGSHVQCSESFYKDWIEAEISSRGRNDKNATRKTLDTLRRMHQEEEEVKDAEDDLDSDDDDDLAERLEGVDLEDADQVWKRLTPEERAEFEKMCATGYIQSLVPEFIPWWDSSKNEVKLVHDVTPDVANEKAATKVSVRPVFAAASVPPLKSLIGNKPPSPTIKFSLLNVVYAYAYAMKLLGGHERENSAEFVSVCLAVSANLRDGQNYDSADVAVESAASAANQNPEISVGADVCRSVKKDVLLIVRGPSIPGEQKNGFLLSALSDLKQIFNETAVELKKNKKKKPEVGLDRASARHVTPLPPWKTQNFAPKSLDLTKVTLAAKKIDFYLSWVSDCYHEYELFYK